MSHQKLDYTINGLGFECTCQECGVFYWLPTAGHPYGMMSMDNNFEKRVSKLGGIEYVRVGSYLRPSTSLRICNKCLNGELNDPVVGNIKEDDAIELLDFAERELKEDELSNHVSIGSYLSDAMYNLLHYSDISKQEKEFLKEKLEYIEWHMLRLCQSSQLDPPHGQQIQEMIDKTRAMIS